MVMTPATMDVDYDTLRRASGGPLEDALISIPAAMATYEKGTELVEKWEIDQAKKLLLKAYEVQDSANDKMKTIAGSLKKANVGRYEGGAENPYYMPLAKNMVNNSQEMQEMFKGAYSELRKDIPGLPSDITFDMDGLNSMVKRIERRFIIASGGANGLVLLRKEAKEAKVREEDKITAAKTLKATFKQQEKMEQLKARLELLKTRAEKGTLSKNEEMEFWVDLYEIYMENVVATGEDKNITLKEFMSLNKGLFGNSMKTSETEKQPSIKDSKTVFQTTTASGKSLRILTKDIFKTAKEENETVIETMDRFGVTRDGLFWKAVLEIEREQKKLQEELELKNLQFKQQQEEERKNKISGAVLRSKMIPWQPTSKDVLAKPPVNIPIR